MENYAQHLRSSTASKEIFPNVALGFTDSVAAVREETVKVITTCIIIVTRSAICHMVLPLLGHGAACPKTRLQCAQQPAAQVLSQVPNGPGG